ncbi:MAG: DUF1501 domain-containing protein [Verrucomicrobiales bacterium]
MSKHQILTMAAPLHFSDSAPASMVTLKHEIPASQSGSHELERSICRMNSASDLKDRRRLVASSQWNFLAASLLFAASLTMARAQEITPEQREFFEAKVRPVLAEHCYSCHNSVDKMKGDLALDYRGGVLAKVVIPGDPAKSPLILAVKHDKDYEPMPSKAPKLSSLSIKHLEEWVAMGAPDPRVEKPTKTDLEQQMDWGAMRDRRAQWWSFQPVVKSEPAQAEDAAWNGGALDRFLYAGLKANGLQPASVADPGTLVRRLHLILTGLPPSPEVVAAFVAQPTEEAYTALVDGLLASPRYGERWSRYWMDWYRYAESHGSEGDPGIPHAPQYRDYLIRAFNADVPGDQLIGDLKDRGMLDETLIVFTGEFGRTPFSQGSNGRDHNPYGFSVWMAGGGIKGGVAYGATDDLGYRAVTNVSTVYDLWATVLHQLGIDHERLTFRWSGRDLRLTDVHGNIIRDILA